MVKKGQIGGGRGVLGVILGGGRGVKIGVKRGAQEQGVNLGVILGVKKVIYKRALIKP